jgi:hypothetical protein
MGLIVAALTAGFTRHLTAADPTWRTRGLGTRKLIGAEGQHYGPELGYIPLSADVVSLEKNWT